MSFFNKMTRRQHSDLSAPDSPPLPPTEEEMGLPPLPPEKDLELPNLSPEEERSLQSAPPPMQPAAPEPVQEYPPRQEAPYIPTAEDNRIVDEYEQTELNPTETKLPLGAMTSPHFPGSEDAIPRKDEGPLFIKVDDFRMFIDGQNRIKTNLKEADNIITRMNEIKIEEDKQFEKWRSNLEEINKKISIVDKKIFGPK